MEIVSNIFGPEIKCTIVGKKCFSANFELWVISKLWVKMFLKKMGIVGNKLRKLQVTRIVGKTSYYEIRFKNFGVFYPLFF